MVHQIDMFEKRKVAQNLIPSNFGFIAGSVIDGVVANVNGNNFRLPGVDVLETLK